MRLIVLKTNFVINPPEEILLVYNIIKPISEPIAGDALNVRFVIYWYAVEMPWTSHLEYCGGDALRYPIEQLILIRATWQFDRSIRRPWADICHCKKLAFLNQVMLLDKKARLDLCAQRAGT